jgi:[ribosomal protein S18]-alanine N-acetyltransferase
MESAPLWVRNDAGCDQEKTFDLPSACVDFYYPRVNRKSPRSSSTATVRFRQLAGHKEARVLARMMSQSEPWITLRRSAGDMFELLADRALETYVAIADGQLAGVIVVNMNGAFVGYIRGLAVVPEWRSRGIGSQLMKFAEGRIFRQSPNVFLCVSGFNPRAQRFYRRLGYRRIGELKNYVIDGASEILMRKTIGPKVGFKPASR